MSRLLSVLSTCICGQTALQRALNVAKRLVVVRFTQTQPVSANAEPLTDTACSPSTDPNISLFHRPTKISVDFSDICDTAEHATIHCRFSGEVVDVCFKKSVKESLRHVQQKIREEAFHSEAIAVESVDELIYKEIKPRYEYRSLPSLYSKLAKLRLTGTFCASLHVCLVRCSCRMS